MKSLARVLRLAARYAENPQALLVKFAGGIPGTFHQLDQAWFHRLNIRTVIDVGANEGQFSRTLRKILPTAQIYAFEPIPECFARTRTHFSSDSRFKIFNLALAERKGRAHFTVASGDTGASSLLAAGKSQREYFPHTLNSRQIEVEIDTLDDALSAEIVAAPYLVKIDVQGYEYEVLAGGRKTIAGATLVIVEASHVPFYEGQKLFNDVYDVLRTHDFRLLEIFNAMRAPGTGEVLQGDFLFSR